jgi:4a-hydroxytetrahydrobiopterin dehydratase
METMRDAAFLLVYVQVQVYVYVSNLNLNFNLNLNSSLPMEDKTPLTDDQVAAALAALDGWQRDGIFIRKDFVFANFAEINQFLPHLTATIVAQNHHPDFSLVCAEKKVAVEVTTHSAGGLTQADINLATALNGWR